LKKELKIEKALQNNSFEDKEVRVGFDARENEDNFKRSGLPFLPYEPGYKR